MRTPRPRSALGLALALLALPVVGKPAPKPTPPPPLVDNASGDRWLHRGDVLFKLLGEESKLTARGIAAGETVIKALDRKFNTAARLGSADAVHALVYLGKGRTAEAFGGGLKDARVAAQTLETHAGFMFYVFRPKDEALADAAAAVAERWATGRMKYLIPVRVPLGLSTYGPRAHEEALDYGRAANQVGGPPDYRKMFCSQFAIAVYQAAVAATELARDPHLEAGDLEMPYALQLHASRTSPLILHGRLTAAGEPGRGAEWVNAGRVLVRSRPK